MIRYRSIAVVSIAFITTLATAQTGSQPKRDNCKSACYTYTQLINNEKLDVEKLSPRPKYLPYTSGEGLLRVRLLNPHPEVDHPVPSVDDELRVYVNDKDIWHVTYHAPDNKEGTTFTLNASSLPLRLSKIVVKWRNTEGPDAHFFVELGGSLVCSHGEWCGRVYREGYSFGTHMISPQKAELDLLKTDVWRSSVQPPPAPCVCN